MLRLKLTVVFCYLSKSEFERFIEPESIETPGPCMEQGCEHFYISDLTSGNLIAQSQCIPSPICYQSYQPMLHFSFPTSACFVIIRS